MSEKKTINTEKSLEKIKEQLKESYDKAFKDALEKELNEDKFDWVCKLHRELVIRICSLIPNRPSIHDRIAENMDPIIFRQMLENKAFNFESLGNLINYVFGWIKKLCSPFRDPEIQSSIDDIYKMAQEGGTVGKIVPHFIFEVHRHIDNIEKDMKGSTAQDFKKFAQVKKAQFAKK